MENLQKFERMAKFDLPQEERDFLQAQADRLDRAFSMLEAIDTQAVPPLLNVLGMQNVLREDVAVQPFTREELLVLAPQQQDGCFQVPKTLE